MAMHHPFTHPKVEDIPYIEERKDTVKAKAYDIVINGEEIGGGSIRINNSDLQEKMFKALGFTKNNLVSSSRPSSTELHHMEELPTV